MKISTNISNSNCWSKLKCEWKQTFTEDFSISVSKGCWLKSFATTDTAKAAFMPELTTEKDTFSIQIALEWPISTCQLYPMVLTLPAPKTFSAAYTVFPHRGHTSELSGFWANFELFWLFVGRWGLDLSRTNELNKSNKKKENSRILLNILMIWTRAYRKKYSISWRWIAVSLTLQAVFQVLLLCPYSECRHLLQNHSL